MATLADQLREKGLISEERYHQHKRLEEDHEQTKQGALKNKFVGA